MLMHDHVNTHVKLRLGFKYCDGWGPTGYNIWFIQDGVNLSQK